MATLKELRDIRIEKLNKLRKLGINPFPSKANKDCNNSDVTEKHIGKNMCLAGRIRSWREHGKLIFTDIEDYSGKIQVYIHEDIDKTSEKNQTIGFSDLNLLDIGDFIEVTGEITKTKSGQLSIKPGKIRLLTKTLRQLPEQLANQETIFRKRYVDLAIHKKRRELFERKAKFWEVNRTFMKKEGFIEVETPILEKIPGGADARPFITHMNALGEDFYLRISPELYLKRLVGGGFEKVFVIGPNFRNEGLSDEHLPEFYNIEWYWAYADYNDNMKMIERMFKYIAQEVYGKTEFSRGKHTFDLGKKWETIDYVKVIKERFDVDIFETSDEQIKKILDKNNVELPGVVNRHRLIDNLWKLIRKDISGPAFLLNEPKFMSPLAKSKEDNPNLTERFHIIIAGSELGNGYSELNDPVDQFERFLDQQKNADAGDEEAQRLDIDYVEMLEYGMPPTSGYAHGERLFWFLEGVTAREGTLFPQMRFKYDDHVEEIYGINVSKENMDEHVDTGADSKDGTSKNETINEEIDESDLSGLPTQKDAQKLLEKHVDNDYQKHHAKMVAEVLGAYAKKLGENYDLWYITGLLHDLDYFKHPDEHPKKSLEWFSEWGYPKALAHAVSAHAHIRTKEAPQTRLAAYLIATDELAGLLYAYSLMRDTGFEGMKVKSAKKKFKDKAFARKIDREEIMFGVEHELFDFDLDAHLEFMIGVFGRF